MTETLPIDQAETIPVPSDSDRSDTGADDVGRSDADRSDDGGALGASADRASRPSLYREALRRMPRDLGYLAFTALLLSTVYLGFPQVLAVGAGVGIAHLGPVWFLMFFVALFIARWLGAFERLRIGWAEPRPIRPVDWTPRWQQNQATRVLSAVANPHYWLSLLHAVVVYPLVGIVTIGAGVLLVAGFFGPIVAGIYALVNGWRINELLAQQGVDQTWPWVVGAIACAVCMATAVALFPLWTRGATLAHYWVDHALLGGFRAEALQQRVVGLQQSRAGAVTAEGQALRQIERDLHDGPQQRLVRLRMDLAAAERALAANPDRARTLIVEASGHAQDALDELRALSRGFAPPILLDRGLVAALEALVSRTPIPVGLDIRLPEGLALPSEVERNVYFTVSELLTNTTKHAGASRAGVFMGLLQDFYGRQILTVSVTDDGRGGARVEQGHGIEGLIGRMRALDGELIVSSPDGGPTEATARVPLVGLHGVPTDRPGSSTPPRDARASETRADTSSETRATPSSDTRADTAWWRADHGPTA